MTSLGLEPTTRQYLMKGDIKYHDSVSMPSQALQNHLCVCGWVYFIVDSDSLDPDPIQGHGVNLLVMLITIKDNRR